jgi:hypothetical protein
MQSPGPGRLPVGLKQLSHVQGGRTNLHTGGPTVDPSDVEEFLMPGFHALDAAMKMYWSGMRVPTADSYRFCRVKVAGGDKSLLIWRDDLANGRARLPVASLNQSKAEFNKNRFSPAYMPMGMRFSSKGGNRVLSGAKLAGCGNKRETMTTRKSPTEITSLFFTMTPLLFVTST